jgi:dTDP-4-dehydrorhamnose 3,5-epimerase
MPPNVGLYFRNSLPSKETIKGKMILMKATPLKISGSWKINFQKFNDNRGFFYESFKEEDLKREINRTFVIKQTNTSSSTKGSVRGIHYAMVPPSQAKLVQCQRGSIKDYVIDIRVGSPTFGQFEEISLDENSASAIFIEEGLAHAFVSLENQTVVTYYVSEKYNPEREKGINPFDKTLNVLWPKIDLIVSDKDKEAISLTEAKEQGLLPTFDECKKFIKSLN